MGSTTERTAMRRSARLIPVAAIAVAAVVIAGCGSSSSTSSAGAGQIVKGGTATVLETAGGVDSLDPGYWYYQTDYEDLLRTTQRALYTFTDTGTTPVPDLASALPTVSNGGKTLTVHIRSGIHYSAPLASQTVTSADVKYAMERCFLASVGNGYAFAYYPQIVGAPSAPATKLPNLTGIQTPNSTTLVINTKVPVGVLADANALSLPCTVPVPQSYAAKYDSGVDLLVRDASGVHRAVHDLGGELRHDPELRLSAGQAADTGSQHELERVDRSVGSPRTSTRSCSRAATTSRSRAGRCSAAPACSAATTPRRRCRCCSRG